MTYRVLGSPYALLFHQHVAYLRLKRLPFKVYCRTFATTLFYAWVFRARNSFCTVAPNGKSYLQLWQLVSAVERSGIRQSKSFPSCGKATVAEEENDIQFVIDRHKHPNIHMVNWVIVLYSSWWLAKTGAMYRWVEGDGIDTIEGYLRYFFLVPGVGAARAIAGSFKQAIQKVTSVTGVSKETAPYMKEHFFRLCDALEVHFQEQTKRGDGSLQVSFLLGTPHPTLADVAFGSVFSANFLMDDPPASVIAQKYPHLNCYLEAVTGWKGGVFVGDDGVAGAGGVVARGMKEGDTDECSTYLDVVPDSLFPVLKLVEEVLPFMLSQCEAFHAYMVGDGVRGLKKERLEGPWEGCSGYLLSQITGIKSLMIIDNGVYTVAARAQDLEVALLAAREVVGNDDEDGGGGGGGNGNNSVISTNSEECRGETAHVFSRCAEDAAKQSGCPGGTFSAVEEVQPNTREGGGVAPSIASVVDVTHEGHSNDHTDSDGADFHRVFTSASGRSRSVLLHPRHSGQVAQSMMDSCLFRLRDILRKMHHPHYTLSSVFHGRKMFVAVIPECEVIESRKRKGNTSTIVV